MLSVGYLIVMQSALVHLDMSEIPTTSAFKRPLAVANAILVAIMHFVLNCQEEVTSALVMLAALVILNGDVYAKNAKLILVLE